MTKTEILTRIFDWEEIEDVKEEMRKKGYGEEEILHVIFTKEITVFADTLLRQKKIQEGKIKKRTNVLKFGIL